MLENCYNLIDEDWIPIANRGKVSLRTIFNTPDLPNLGGNPVEKISLMKLLFAIAQASYTPKDNAEWKNLGSAGMAKACLEYLEKWHDAFYLYGDKPFLQMPQVVRAGEVPYGAVIYETSSIKNTTVLTQNNLEKQLDESQKALLLLLLMSFDIGNKRTDKSYKISQNYSEKKATSGFGPSLEYKGLLHSFYLGNTLQESLYYNLLTLKDINKERVFLQGLGKPIWEEMPRSENCQRANEFKESLQGRLVPLCRFCLLKNKSLHYTEGVKHLSYKAGMIDPTASLITTKKEVSVIWVNPEKRPWRSLTSLLSFIKSGEQFTKCLQLTACFERIKHAPISSIGVFSGGLSVTTNSGDQSVKHTDDYVSSSFMFPLEIITNSDAYVRFEKEMEELEKISYNLEKCVENYYEKFKPKNEDRGKPRKLDNQSKNFASKATLTFWSLAERKAQELINICSSSGDILSLRREFASYIHKAFQSVCPADTARQLQAFVQTKPNLSKYLKSEIGE